MESQIAGLFCLLGAHVSEGLVQRNDVNQFKAASNRLSRID
jgi:hypothetical protein